MPLSENQIILQMSDLLTDIQNDEKDEEQKIKLHTVHYLLAGLAKLTTSTDYRVSIRA